jgi:hypothetical protein
MSPPPFLYRYRKPSDFALKEIVNNSAWLCSLADLNDPREGRYRVEPSDIVDLREQLISDCLREGDAEGALLLKYLPDEGIRQIEQEAMKKGEAFLNVRKTWGVICFSPTHNNDSLWWSYAQNGEGVVIEYNLKDIDIPHGAIHEVTYQDAPEVVTLADVLNPANAGKFAEVLACKSTGG